MFQRTSDSRHYPFELPSGWVWTTLGEIGKWQAGGTPNRTIKSYYGGEIPWLKTGDLNDGIIENIPESITEEALQNSSAKLNPTNSILIAMYGATIGKLGILSYPAATNQACCACIEYSAVEKYYLFYFLLSHRHHFIYKGGGGAQPNISKEKILNTAIPLPPIEEQRRIIKTIEKWFLIINIVEANKNEALECIKVAKNKILDLAIHGKLVPQHPADEPAIKLLKRVNPSAEITCDNEQYWNMPNGWCVCRIKDLFKICMGQSPAGTSLNQIEGMEFHQGKICFTDKFLDKSKILTNRPTKIADANSLLICVRAPVGVLNINTRQICIGRGLCALLPSKCVDLGFAFHCLTTYQQRFEQKSTGSTFKAISGDIIKNELFPLPPLAEQQRIVAKIEELFAQLDAIENSLQA